MICDSCGNEITLGAWPFCPHGRGANTVVPDDVPGGFLAVNGFDEPRRFYSHSAHEKALAAEGCEIRAKYAGPLDKIMTNWAAGIDPQTLANVTDLLSRGPVTAKQRKERWPNASIPIDVTEGDAFRISQDKE